MAGARRKASTLLREIHPSLFPTNVEMSPLPAQYLRWNNLGAASALPECIVHRGFSTNSLWSYRLLQGSTCCQLGRSSLDASLRGMAIKISKNNARKSGQQPEPPLMNEKLVKSIMAKWQATPPEEIRLRLLVEKDSSTPVTSEETSLAEAIRIAADLGLDLVEIDSKQRAPVVRAVNYEAKLYHTSKSKLKTKSKDPFSVVKEFRFKAKTSDHDLQRKVKDVVEALKKGHRCKLSATCPSRVLPTTPEGALDVIKIVLREVGPIAEEANPPEVNAEKTHASVVLLPCKNS